MRTRQAFALIFILANVGGASAQRAGPLRVIRTSPSNDATVTSKIMITFDRPVAGSLDRTIDPAAILRVEPAIPGLIEWRDPVTIRLTPSAMLVAGRSYTVTVANSFRAMDGSALAEPHRFTFRVQGPVLLAGWPVGQDREEGSLHLTPNQRFDLVYSSAVDLAKLSASAFLEFSNGCSGPQIIRLNATAQRRIREDDRPGIREAGGWRRDRSADSLRRVIQLTPQAPLPRGCGGDLVAPKEVADETIGNLQRSHFSTYGDFKIISLNCGDPNTRYCPTGPLTVTFSNPVRGADVLRRLSFLPAAKFTVDDTLSESATWTLNSKLALHTSYALVADPALRDAFGQPLTGNPAAGYRTTGYEPVINNAYGHLLVERVGFRTLAVQHTNVDTLIATIAPVPDSLEARALGIGSWGNEELWTKVLKGAMVQRIAVNSIPDRAVITGVRMPTLNAMRKGTPTLFAVKIGGRAGGADVRTGGPTSLLQVTDIGIHARIGVAEGVVWVTGVSDGLSKAGAEVSVHDARGKVLATARTDAQGIARFARLPQPAPLKKNEDDDNQRQGFEGYVSVTLGTDRAVTAIKEWGGDLSPYQFNVSSAWGDDRIPLAGAAFTERGIYKPGERVYAKAIVRVGPLGALRAATTRDSVRWTFNDREGSPLRTVATTLSSFGTADQSLELSAGAPVGEYQLEVHVKWQGKWRRVAGANYRVAEYRPPEFLVDLSAPSQTRLTGEVFSATASARYLFGAPMGRAEISWQARQTAVSAWELEVPGTEGWYIGDSGSWWEDEAAPETNVFASRTDTLDARGSKTYSVTLPATPKGRAARVTIDATVTDINRQVVGTSTTTMVHPAEFYLAARTTGDSWFWKAGTPQSVQVLAVRPDGQKVAGVRIRGAVVLREWHRVRRERDGVSELIGDWVSDTIATCTVTSATAAMPCGFTPKAGGAYTVTFTATDRRGHVATTSFQRWASGEGWVPWSDETQFKMDVIPDRTRYAVGDTATIMFASPFTGTEAWITVEREGLIEQRRITITSGSTTMKFPITEAYAPNAYVSIVVARGRSAKPGYFDDLGRPTIRVGYAELRVTPEVKRLAVTVSPEKADYRPADTARVRVRVRDRQGRGARSEVTLWAVDEGVLALTGYKTPDPLDLVYRERGLGMRLASNMTAVAPQVPEGEKGWRNAGGGGGVAGADILRSRFQTTAFFLGSVITDAQGNAVASAKLPDNITTFRVMAVAVTAGDRYGSGESPMLVTRPLLARQALPRFVRPGDVFSAGAVINRRDGSAATVTVRASSTGASLRGDSTQTATLAAQRGTEVRFPFTATRTDSASFRFDVSDGRNADAVRVAIPVKSTHHPVVHTLAGVLRDTATVDFPLPAGLDLDRSRLSVSIGSSPLAAIRGIRESLRIYPYYCTEQVISSAIPLIALFRAQKEAGGETLPGNPRRDIARAAEMLGNRQREDGGIGYWSSTDWTSPWLTAYAGMVMLDARDAGAGVKVDTLVLRKLAAYLTADLHGTASATFTPVAYWSTRREYRLREQVAAVDFLSRYGRPDVASENELIRAAAQLTIEDRARLAEVLARRKQTAAARRLMEPTWALLKVEGRRAVLPDSARSNFYFESRTRPIARILTATLAVDPEHALIGPLAESLVQETRASGAGWMWNTQDYGAAANALAELHRRQRADGERSVRVRSDGKVLIQGGARDSSIALSVALANPSSASRSLRLWLDAGAGNAPVYYYLSVTEVPSAPPVTQEDRGIQVERWYERIAGGAPVSTVAEGDLVRVRLRITVPSTRYFVVVDDALPAGLEAVDLSLRTASANAGPGVSVSGENSEHEESNVSTGWFGRWDSGWWSPFDHHEIRDDRVVYSANQLWAGSYTATYIARATTPGTFIRPPAHAEEMYNPAVNGRSDGGTLVVTAKPAPR